MSGPAELAGATPGHIAYATWVRAATRIDPGWLGAEEVVVKWPALPATIQEAWEAAAGAVLLNSRGIEAADAVAAVGPVLDNCGQPYPCAHRAHNPDVNHPDAAAGG